MRLPVLRDSTGSGEPYSDAGVEGERSASRSGLLRPERHATDVGACLIHEDERRVLVRCGHPRHGLRHHRCQSSGLLFSTGPRLRICVRLGERCSHAVPHQNIDVVPDESRGNLHGILSRLRLLEKELVRVDSELCRPIRVVHHLSVNEARRSTGCLYRCDAPQPEIALQNGETPEQLGGAARGDSATEDHIEWHTVCRPDFDGEGRVTAESQRPRPHRLVDRSLDLCCVSWHRIRPTPSQQRPSSLPVASQQPSWQAS